jgi:lactate permease
VASRSSISTCAILGLIVALAVAIFAYGMPVEMAGKSALYGALFDA